MIVRRVGIYAVNMLYALCQYEDAARRDGDDDDDDDASYLAATHR